MRAINKSKWKCASCKQPKATTSSSKSPNSNEEASSGKIDTAGIMAYMDKHFALLNDKFDNFKTSVSDQLATLTKSVASWEKRILDLETKCGELTNCATLVKKQDSEMLELNGTITMLQDQLNNQEQFYLRNELEISGLTEMSNENLLHTTLLSAQKLGVELSVSDIDGASRVGPRPTQPDAEPRPVVVRLLRSAKRNQLIQAARVRKNLTTKDVELSGKPRTVYFNERLTKHNRTLFRDTRIRAKSYGYKFYWVRNGVIYVRKDEQKKPKTIRNYYELDSLVGPAPKDGPSE
ncbi:uncharacterized protein LOC119693172 [Plutella xylostella]|uniref:uncharacterized protein LOC119693172 n=1 Tax=Plutella xylostella TaxID=51655 RepID=UPI002032A484|nr:uncharacterized protein LOC119693172 [Plutella xylostella]